MNLQHLRILLLIIIFPFGVILALTALSTYFTTLVLPLFIALEQLVVVATENKISDIIIRGIIYLSFELYKEWRDWSVLYIIFRFFVSLAAMAGVIGALLTPFVVCYGANKPQQQEQQEVV